METTDRISYESVADIRTRLDCGWDLPEDIRNQLASVMFRRDLDPRISADVAEGFRLIGINPADYGL